MNTNQLSDSVFEALFRQAVIDSIYEEIDELPPDEELAAMYTFSDAHEARMKKLFARESRSENFCLVAKWIRWVAAIIMISVAILFGSLMLVPQVRATVVQTITDENMEYTVIEIDGIEYHLFTSEDDSIDSVISWEINGQRYTIASTISAEELLNIAKSVKN